MITSKQSITLSTESKFDSVTFVLDSVIALDSMTGDSVSIDGVTSEALHSAILSYARSCSGYHEGPEGDFLRALIKECNRVLEL